MAALHYFEVLGQMAIARAEHYQIRPKYGCARVYIAIKKLRNAPALKKALRSRRLQARIACRLGRRRLKEIARLGAPRAATHHIVIFKLVFIGAAAGPR